MNKMTKRIREVEHRLVEAADAYYNQQPIIDDDEYDALVDELHELDPNNEILSRVGSPPNESTPLQKVKHEIPMGSQFKVNTEEDFLKWVNKTEVNNFVVQEKLDGISVELLYRQGELTKAITRGNGFIGEDITHTVMLMQNVKKELPIENAISLRGEIILSKSAFEEHFSEAYANPRNTASGVARRKMPDERTKYLAIFYYDALVDGDTTGKAFETEINKIKFIKSLGIKTVPTKEYNTTESVASFLTYQNSKRSKLDYEIDGLIIKVNDLEVQQALGLVANRPKGQIAWKFASEMRETELLDISWEVGLTGRITPVAHLKPVGIGGVTVSKASLYNASNVRNLQLGKGSIVLVSRRNDVIPAVEKLVRNPVITRIPAICPVCTNKVDIQGEYLVCINKDCPAKKWGDIKKWVDVLEIDQIGEAFIRTGLLSGTLTDVSSLYTLTLEDVCNLEGYKEKSAQKVIDNINKTREIPFVKFMAALNIPDAGQSAFGLLEEAGYRSLKDFNGVSSRVLQGIPGIGPATAKAIIKGLHKKEPLIKKILKNGVTIKKKEEGKLTGQSFCFTGQISIRRGDAQKLVESMGGTVKSGVSKGLTYLVQADPNSQSGKAVKAKKYGTKVIGEDEFMELVEFSFKKLVK